MEDEKLLPPGESEITSVPHAPEMRIHKRPVEPVPEIIIPSAIPSSLPPLKRPEPILPPSLPGMPSPQAQQWGVVISIVIIMLMIIIGAFYAWGQRIAQNQPPTSIIQ